MKYIELKPNENIIDYVVENSKELNGAKIMLQNVELSKYGFIKIASYPKPLISSFILLEIFTTFLSFT